MKPRRDHWDFHYEPSSAGYSTREPGSDATLDIVVATSSAPLDQATLRRALNDLGPSLSIETLVERAPLFWTRVRASAFASAEDVSARLDRAGVSFRYVASASTGAMSLAPRLALSDADRAYATNWSVREARPLPAASSYEGQWFLGDSGGVSVDRQVCGTAAGTRLAVIEDDAADLDQVDLDERVPIGLSRVPTVSGHAGLMVGWATSARRPDGERFIGIAPDASVRVYLIPKPDTDIVSLPLAIVRAVFDGADVIVCATYVEGATSPLLDDALDVATHLGRNGRGAVIVLPTGRETSSSGASVHASLSLEFGDPASDPRVHCVAPGSTLGGWFLWQTPRGKLRPFANRGPAVRWLAPGDDLAYPFSARDRLFHAESSGASAIAAGVMLLVLARNPELELHELHALLERSVDEPPEPIAESTALADPADVLPRGPDRDGHNAKCGYGRLNARRACAIAADPFAFGLVAIGEEERAIRWAALPARPYSDPLARWAIGALLARADLEHALRAVLRHLRLIAGGRPRPKGHAPGALLRQLSLIVRELGRMPAPSHARLELEQIGEKLRLSSGAGCSEAAEHFVCSMFRELVGFPSASSGYECSAPGFQS
jgi:hypothetical protein